MPTDDTRTPDPLRSAAQWLVDIWADNIAIERGSALWEDIQTVRAALHVTDTLDVERLANATARVVGHVGALDWHRDWAEKVAAEYARLTEANHD